MKKLILLSITFIFILNFKAQMAITSSAFDKSTQNEIKDLIDNNPTELMDRFYKDLVYM